MRILGELEVHDEVILNMDIPENFRLEGWIYILENPSMPNIYKVGMTTVDPDVRAKELSGSTGVPTPFKVVESYYSSDPRGDEKLIHEYLSESRVNQSREFFNCPLSEIKDLCTELCISKTGTTTEELAMDYEIITFEELKSIDFDELFEDLGVSFLGSKVALAERLIRIGVDTLRKQNFRKNLATVFKDSVMYKIKDIEGQYFDEHGNPWESPHENVDTKDFKGGF